MQLLVDNRNDSTKMHGATIRFIDSCILHIATNCNIVVFMTVCVYIYKLQLCIKVFKLLGMDFFLF